MAETVQFNGVREKSDADMPEGIRMKKRNKQVKSLEIIVSMGLFSFMSKEGAL